MPHRDEADSLDRESSDARGSRALLLTRPSLRSWRAGIAFAVAVAAFPEPARADAPELDAAHETDSLAAKPSGYDFARDEALPDAKRARALWEQGVTAFAAGEYDRARQAFAECQRLMPHPAVLRNLSLSEYHGGHYVLAATHISELFLAPGELELEARTRLQQLLARAETRVGKIIVEVDIDGSSILVDGESVGRTPLKAAVYVEPGEHEVQVERGGYPAQTQRVSTPAGKAAFVNVSFDSLRRARSEDVRAAQLMGTDEGQTPPDDGIYPAAVLTGLGTATAALLAGGIYFTVSANRNESDAQALEQTLSLGSTSTCNGQTPFTRECGRFHQAQDDEHSDRKWAAGSFIGAGVVGTATLAYAIYVLSSDDEAEETPAAVTPALAISPQAASIQLTTRF